MRCFFILMIISVFLFLLGQMLFSQRPAVSGAEAIALSHDMRHAEREAYLLGQAERFFDEGRFGETFELTAFLREKLGSVSQSAAELLEKSREQLEEEALVEAEKLKERVRDMVEVSDSPGPGLR